MDITNTLSDTIPDSRGRKRSPSDLHNHMRLRGMFAKAFFATCGAFDDWFLQRNEELPKQFPVIVTKCLFSVLDLLEFVVLLGPLSTTDLIPLGNVLIEDSVKIDVGFHNQSGCIGLFQIVHGRASIQLSLGYA